MQYKIQSGVTKRNTARYLSESALIKWKIKKYHTVGTILKSKLQKEATSIPLTHKYMAAHFHGRGQTLQYKKWRG